MVEIIPAIMPKNLADLELHAKRVLGHVPVVQVDIMDGVFVKGKTWPYTKEGEKEFNTFVRKEKHLPSIDTLDYEVDLMVSEPEHVIEDWMHAGVSRMIVHLESTKNMENIIRDVDAHVTRAQNEDLEVVSLGIAINTVTPVEFVDPYIDHIDFVQCMGIAEIGAQGQPFDERVIGQLQELRTRHPELTLSVDGAVHFDNARALVLAGADRLVSGSEIFESVDVKESIEKFNAIVGDI